MIYRLTAYLFIILGLAGTLYMGISGVYGENYDVPAISSSSFHSTIADSGHYLLLDIRTPAERDTLWLKENLLMEIPLLDLEAHIPELAPYQQDSIIVLGPTGRRARQGARILRRAGFQAYYLTGGFQALVEDSTRD